MKLQEIKVEPEFILSLTREEIIHLQQELSDLYDVFSESDDKMGRHLFSFWIQEINGLIVGGDDNKIKLKESQVKELIHDISNLKFPSGEYLSMLYSYLIW